MTNRYNFQQVFDNTERIQGYKNVMYSVAFDTLEGQIGEVIGIPSNIAVILK